MEKTLAIIKPDAFKAGKAGLIIDEYIKAGFAIKAMKLLQMTKEIAKGFYIVHKDRPFYDELTDFMSSGPCVVLVLAGDNVIKRNRDLMGPTNSKEAGPETIRGKFGTDLQNNAVHGSDGPDTAVWEIKYFFSELEIL